MAKRALGALSRQAAVPRLDRLNRHCEPRAEPSPLCSPGGAEPLPPRRWFSQQERTGRTWVVGAPLPRHHSSGSSSQSSFPAPRPKQGEAGACGAASLTAARGQILGSLPPPWQCGNFCHLQLPNSSLQGRGQRLARGFPGRVDWGQREPTRVPLPAQAPSSPG